VQEPATTVPEASNPDPLFVIDPSGSVVSYGVEVVSAIPHSTDAFTQGLEVNGGLFLESTGQYGRSEARLLGLDGNEYLAVDLEDEFFAEGLTVVGDRVIQLTWKEETAFVRDADNLVEIERFSYDGEGWGLCFDGASVVMSDGSDQLTFRDPETFTATGSVAVTWDGKSIDRLNELECIDGYVLANRWQTNQIFIVDPADGRVVGVVDAAPLVSALSSTDGIDVLNGIAYDADTGRLYMTGKYWPEIFEVRLVPAG
jgi:glutamine cyclotransferase